MLEGKKILIGISGGIAAYKICYLVRYFIRHGAEVKVIMTPSAVNFVSPVTLSALSKNEVIINMFSPHEDVFKLEKAETKTWHVNLGLWADVFVIAPATANTLAKINHGICDNFLLTAVLAARCPVFLAPAMDDDMIKNPVSKNNIKSLQEYGYRIIEPEYGELASGLTGEGRMAEPEKIFEILKEFLTRRNDLKGKKILVTAGPTVEFLDRVRFITNSSTGKMGFEIARAANDRGASVTLVTGPVGLSDIQGVKRINVKTADDMFKEVKSNYKNKDLIIMSAAVEDFVPVNTGSGKIKKEEKDTFIFEFKRAVDILQYIGERKKNFKLIGFALETNNEIENARAKLKKKNLDMIVSNNPDSDGSGFGTDTNKVNLITSKNIESLPLMSKYDVGNAILDKYLKMK
ncbi:MAG: bifunctional phosphopantothenoylcysteine decarboxylase/phosphopantothenate--cysteine ligase CoaBC [Ignavibacteria bacterium]|nr:bifunctional phosphopantothenoylcysteine decarboxylase/phosphopantothenate--cysteine ligase CoaBC [Ignavibacteria bacterium]